LEVLYGQLLGYLQQFDEIEQKMTKLSCPFFFFLVHSVTIVITV